MTKTVSFLNTQVANFGVLYTKLHHHHWMVKGPSFFTLHAKFEELYNSVAEYLDEVAERVLSLGGVPFATMKQYLAEATLKEAEGNYSAEEMVQSVIQDFQLLIEEFQGGIELAQGEHDEGSADLLIELQSELQKQVWMLRSFLNN